MRNLLIVAVLGLTGITSSPAFATDLPWVGVWSVDDLLCKLKGKSGEAEGAPLNITAKEIIGYENRCTIKSVKPGSFPHSWLVTKECTGEGETMTSQEMFVVNRNGSELNIIDTDGTVLKYQRCP